MDQIKDEEMGRAHNMDGGDHKLAQDYDWKT
jgi:hypothetical protein